MYFKEQFFAPFFITAWLKKIKEGRPFPKGAGNYFPLKIGDNNEAKYWQIKSICTGFFGNCSNCGWQGRRLPKMAKIQGFGVFGSSQKTLKVPFEKN